MSRRLLPLSAAVLATFLAGCQAQSPPDAAAPAPAAAPAAVPALALGELPAAPMAAKKPFEVKAPHGATRNDEYYWLRDDTRENPEMLAYLTAENTYADTVLKPLEALEDTLYTELVARVKQDDSSVPYFENGFWYYTRFETGKEYPIYARREGSLDAPEQVLFEVNTLAEGKSFYQIGTFEVSPDGKLVAYAEDDVGRRQFTVRIKDLATGELLPDVITGVSANLMWGDDSRTLYFVENDPTTLLTKRVKAHTLGQPVADARLVYEETDDTFYMGISRTRSDEYLCIGVQSTVSSELRCAPAANPGEFTVLAPRQRDFEYNADHLGGRWVIHTNWDAENFRIMTLDDGIAWGDRAQWKELVAHSPDVLISDLTLFDDFMAIGERSGGLQRVRIRHNDGKEEFVKADEDAYAMGVAMNAEPGTDLLRYTYTSLTTPASTFDINVKTGERTLLKEQPVLGGFDKANYVTERVWATARDGTKVPVSLLYRKGFQKDGKAPLYQYSYGSYGSSSDPGFNSNVISLVDRGAVYAVAHIRGGQEMGRSWYEDGKLLNKINTFTDFIDVTDYLVKEGYAAPDRVAAMGGSAGGLLMGAVANMAPEKYRAIVAHVPFVDVVTTMLDESIPLTTNEFDEWGNPKNAEYYDYMLSYSPYDQVAAKDYPSMLVTTGLWDSQVQYFEPAKWVARLRATKTDDNPLLLRTNMEAGHGGKSGRFQRYRERAEEYAFVIERLGMAEQAAQ
jgi:oligopeptidase B